MTFQVNEDGECSGIWPSSKPADGEDIFATLGEAKTSLLKKLRYQRDGLNACIREILKIRREAL